jgi:SagB-type dehydrogenase family enzyme
MSKSAQEYHTETSYERHSIQGHALDWANQPDVYKKYPGFEKVSLPEVTEWPREHLRELVEAGDVSAPAKVPSLESLACILMLTHSLTAKARYGGVDFYYRSVASAGALYPFELYLGVRNLAGLDDGMYHHNVGEQSLVRLRSGDPLSELAGALPAGSPENPQLTFLISSIFFRSSWKYRDRAYRYHLLDSGHLMENLTLALRSALLPFKICYDFNDAKVNSLLGLDELREVCLALVCVSGDDVDEAAAGTSLSQPAGSTKEAGRVSGCEIDYPEIREIHASSVRTVSPSDTIEDMRDKLGLVPTSSKPIAPAEQWPEEMTFAEAVNRRRSMRNFVKTELSHDSFSALVESVSNVKEALAVPEASGMRSVSVGFLADNVEGIAPGFYLLDSDGKSVKPVYEGPMMDSMAHICLDQAWLANCALHFLFLTNLELLERTWGPRGYRYAMLTAGRMGQRIYLSATAMKLGCCGIGAFYDSEASRFLGINDKSRMLYLVAAGPVRKWVAT